MDMWLKENQISDPVLHYKFTKTLLNKKNPFSRTNHSTIRNSRKHAFIRWYSSNY